MTLPLLLIVLSLCSLVHMEYYILFLTVQCRQILYYYIEVIFFHL